eukprot:CAMPEP_0194499016 /NCGR_PEP_ID=MMETSP0253-20130528/15463_1 /TAXON_ID=2966 /ORGANISM="Noctiluca scintillans" /LENGTH=84 /DNA_ID=CAMNT_0039340731 /DNA_START=189 /DNA_END=440 /DNA_ORIENTATION=+
MTFDLCTYHRRLNSQKKAIVKQRSAISNHPSSISPTLARSRFIVTWQPTKTVLATTSAVETAVTTLSAEQENKGGGSSAKPLSP